MMTPPEDVSNGTSAPGEIAAVASGSTRMITGGLAMVKSLLTGVVLTLMVALTAWRAEEPPAEPRTINVVVDPRIELLAVIQYLSGYGDWTRLITRYDLPYKNDVAERFARFKDHPAVSMFDDLAHDGFNFDG